MTTTDRWAVQWAVQRWLEAEHGDTRRLPDDVPKRVLVSACRDRAAAEAYAAANREHWGHPARAELRESVGWVLVLDIGPAIERLERGDG